MNDKTKRAMDEEQARTMGVGDGKAKFTPGPWVIERGGEVPFRKAGLSVGGLCWIYPSRNDEAHANLISAAPDGLLLAKAVVENGLVGDYGHALYLGREAQKAEVALRLGLDYEQDRQLELPPTT